jgi:hypothetical protein
MLSSHLPALEMHDISDLDQVLVEMDPVHGITWFHHMNPEFDLTRTLHAKPLVFQMRLAISNSDRLASTIGSRRVIPRSCDLIRERVRASLANARRRGVRLAPLRDDPSAVPVCDPQGKSGIAIRHGHYVK